MARQDAAINLSNTDLTKGYDPRALILATPEVAASFDPRYGQADLWQTGTQSQFSVKYLF